MDKPITIDNTINVKQKKRMYKSEAVKPFLVRQLDDFDNLISPEYGNTYESSPQSEKARECFKEFNEKKLRFSFKEFWWKQIISVHAFQQ